MTLPDDYLRGMDKGVEKGRQEVIDWIEDNDAIDLEDSETVTLGVFPRNQWEYQKKKWGIKK